MMHIHEFDVSFSIREFDMTICLSQMSVISEVNVMPTSQFSHVWYRLPVIGIARSIN